jgi:glucosyl-dolichyl phosphate glucuronosyltransferase
MTGNDRYHVSVVISTYNRSDLLPQALSALVAQEGRGTRFEVIIVNNNSTDSTEQVVRSFIDRGHDHVRLVFEGRPGVSYGRNAGIKASLAPIIAFTDDDVCVDRSWVANIRRAFDKHPDVHYVTGRVLPRWDGHPPAWLTSDTWGGPCVIRDRGPEPIYSRAGQFFPGWATANLAIRRDMLDRAGLFSADFTRGEDLEFILRVWRAGGRGMYAPDVAVTHHVPAERMTKAYHRMWHVREGEIRARLRFKEIFDRDGRIMALERRKGATLLGAPPYVHRELLRECSKWMVATILRRDAESFRHECHVRQLVTYIRHRRAAADPKTGQAAAERAGVTQGLVNDDSPNLVVR